MSQQPWGEQTRTQRLVFYGSIAAFSALLSVAMFTGAWAPSGGTRALYVAAPVAAAVFMVKLLAAAFDRSDKG